MKNKVGIAFVRVDILALWRFANDFQKVGDYEGAGRRFVSIANALLAEDYETDEIAAKLLVESKEFQTKKKKAGQKGGYKKAANERAKAAAKNNDQEPASDTSTNGSQLDAASGNAADDCKAPPSSDNLVADGDTREGSQNFATPKGALLESGTSATTENSPAEAPTGNEGDELATPEGGSLLNSDGSLLESATSAGQQNSVRGSAKPACGQLATGRKQLPPPTKEAVYDFARTAKLDADDAREWFEINFVDRPGCDKDGIVIENWKGHCKNYCRAKAKRRKEED